MSVLMLMHETRVVENWNWRANIMYTCLSAAQREMPEMTPPSLFKALSPIIHQQLGLLSLEL